MKRDFRGFSRHAYSGLSCYETSWSSSNLLVEASVRCADAVLVSKMIRRYVPSYVMLTEG